MTAWARDEIIAYIKKDLLLGQLDLAGAGVSLQDIGDDTPLLDGGLSIGSVDALDLLVAVEKKFGLKLPDTNKAFVSTTCKNVASLAGYVVAELAKAEKPSAA